MLKNTALFSENISLGGKSITHRDAGKSLSITGIWGPKKIDTGLEITGSQNVVYWKSVWYVASSNLLNLIGVCDKKQPGYDYSEMISQAFASI